MAVHGDTIIDSRWDIPPVGEVALPQDDLDLEHGACRILAIKLDRRAALSRDVILVDELLDLPAGPHATQSSALLTQHHAL